MPGEPGPGHRVEDRPAAEGEQPARLSEDSRHHLALQFSEPTLVLLRIRSATVRPTSRSMSWSVSRKAGPGRADSARPTEDFPDPGRPIRTTYGPGRWARSASPPTGSTAGEVVCAGALAHMFRCGGPMCGAGTHDQVEDYLTAAGRELQRQPARPPRPARCSGGAPGRGHRHRRDRPPPRRERLAPPTDHHGGPGGGDPDRLPGPGRRAPCILLTPFSRCPPRCTRSHCVARSCTRRPPARCGRRGMR